MQHVWGIINFYQMITIGVLHQRLTSKICKIGVIHPSKCSRTKAVLGLKAVISCSLGWLTAAACGVEPGKPGEQGTCWGRCSTGCQPRLCAPPADSAHCWHIAARQAEPHTAVHSPSASLAARATPEWSKWFVTVPSGWVLNRTINLCLQGLYF